MTPNIDPASATVAHTTSAAFLKERGIKATEMDSVDGALRAIREGYDAVVFDAPVLQYYVAHAGKGIAQMSGPIFAAEDYGFAFKEGSDLRRQVDAALLSMREDGTYERIRQLWFGAEPYRSRSTPAPEPIRGRFTYAARSALDETGSMLTMMWTSLRQMVTGQRGVEELSSVVGIFNVAGTAAEQGLKGYELDSWFALFAPAGTPADVVQVLNTEINRILASSEIRRKAGESGTDVEQMTPQQLGDFTKKELVYWGKVIQGAKITLE